MAVTAQQVPPAATVPPFVNVIVRTMLRSPLHGLMSKNTMLLTFKGRKSSKIYTIPLTYVQEGNMITCFTNSAWWKNLRGGAPVTLVIKGRELQGVATPMMDDRELIVRELYAFLQKNPRDAKYRSVRLDARKQP